MPEPSAFRPAWWLRNRHLQTLFASRVRARPKVAITWEEIATDDGDFFEVAWTADQGGPVAQIVHGLEGSVHSSYASGIAAALSARGFTVAVQHFRGCGNAINRLDRTYHAGDTGDINHFSNVINTRWPAREHVVVGYSLGGNQVLKWLGEQGDNAPVACAVAVSVPFDLFASAAALESGFSRLYQRHLVRELHDKVSRKFARHAHPPVALDAVSPASSFTEFDDRITAPLHGFASAQDYYSRCSSRAFLKHIGVPTLLLQAEDDPFLEPRGLPRADELSPHITFELSDAGGHVGFVGTRGWLLPHYWLESRIPQYLEAHLGR